VSHVQALQGPMQVLRSAGCPLVHPRHGWRAKNKKCV
jgi:hypothetical protein